MGPRVPTVRAPALSLPNSADSARAIGMHIEGGQGDLRQHIQRKVPGVSCSLSRRHRTWDWP
eukprot:7556560-Pyramimonas_sp.AAC.1